MTSNTADSVLGLVGVEGSLRRSVHGEFGIQSREEALASCDSSDTTCAIEVKPSFSWASQGVASDGMTLFGASELKQMLTEVERLERNYSKMARHQRLSRAIKQIVQFCTKFAPSLDVITQAAGGYAQIIWGPFRALLAVRQRVLGKWAQLRCHRLQRRLSRVFISSKQPLPESETFCRSQNSSKAYSRLT